jgi:hypothetical protein
MCFLHFATATTLCQEEGTATVSFVSESLQAVSPEKMAIDDEEMVMAVAIQMYAGMLSSLQPLDQSCLTVFSCSWNRHSGLHVSSTCKLN